MQLTISELQQADAVIPQAIHLDNRRLPLLHESRKKGDHVGMGGADDPTAQIVFPHADFCTPNDANSGSLSQHRDRFMTAAAESFERPAKMNDAAPLNHKMDYDPNPSAGAVGSRHQPDNFQFTTAYYERYLRDNSSNQKNSTRNISTSVMGTAPATMRRTTAITHGAIPRAFGWQQVKSNDDMRLIENRGTLPSSSIFNVSGTATYENDMESRKFLRKSKPLFSAELAGAMGIGNDIYAQGKTQLQYRNPMPDYSRTHGHAAVQNQSRSLWSSKIEAMMAMQDDGATRGDYGGYGADGLGIMMHNTGMSKASGMTEGLQVGAKEPIYAPLRLSQEPASWQLMQGPRRASSSTWVYDGPVKAKAARGMLVSTSRGVLPANVQGDPAAGSAHAHNQSRHWVHGKQTTGSHHDGSGVSSDIAEAHNNRQRPRDEAFKFQRPLLGEMELQLKKEKGDGALAAAVAEMPLFTVTKYHEYPDTDIAASKPTRSTW